MKHLDLFSGIGGFALATEMVWDNVEHIFCDNEPFAQEVLRKHWPTAKIYDDIKELCTPPTTDIVTGGFPCQPFSAAGLRKGTQDDRHLWPEMLRVIRASAPRWVIGENVGGLLTWDRGLVLDTVLADLESAGYEAWPFVLPAAAVGAPHRRDRVWIIAHANSHQPQKRRTPRQDEREAKASGLQQRDEVERVGESNTLRPTANAVGDASGRTHGRESGERELRRQEQDKRQGDKVWGNSSNGDIPGGQDAANPRGLRRHQRPSAQKRATACSSAQRDWAEDWTQVAARLCTVDDGLRYEVVRPDGGRDAEVRPRPKGWRNAALKGAGNAIVPQVAAQIMLAIKQTDEAMQ